MAKKASKGRTKGKTLKPGKSLEKKQPLTETITFNYGSTGVVYKQQ
jgi:hypothetical protein